MIALMQLLSPGLLHACGVASGGLYCCWGSEPGTAAVASVDHIDLLFNLEHCHGQLRHNTIGCMVCRT